MLSLEKIGKRKKPCENLKTSICEGNLFKIMADILLMHPDPSRNPNAHRKDSAVFTRVCSIHRISCFSGLMCGNFMFAICEREKCKASGTKLKALKDFLRSLLFVPQKRDSEKAPKEFFNLLRTRTRQGIPQFSVEHKINSGGSEKKS